MSGRFYQAICLDLDGTLITDEGAVRPRVRRSLREAEARGVVVMLATGRSEGGVVEVVENLGLTSPVLVYNGAGLWCPQTGRFLEQRVLSDRVVDRTLAWANEIGALPVVMGPGAKVAPAPRNAAEEAAIGMLEDLSVAATLEDLPRERLLRITLLSSRWSDSEPFHDALAEVLTDPVYMTHFPLAALAQHRGSALQVIDVQPPCRGKAEALRWLEEARGIPAERVVCVGDAGNDVPMIEAAGLGVAMQNAFPEALASADRVIGDNNSDTIADLVEELFLETE